MYYFIFVLYSRLEQELNEKDTTLAELSKRLDLSQRQSERRKSSTEELTERRRSTEQQIIELRTNLARTRYSIKVSMVLLKLEAQSAVLIFKAVRFFGC